MEREYYPITGVEELYIAEDVVDTSAGYSAGTPEEFAPAEKIDWTSEQPSEPIYAKNKKLDVIYGTRKESVKFLATGVSEEKDARLRGIYNNPVNGVTYSTGDEEPPHCAVGFKINKGKGDYVFVWMLKGALSGGNIIAETKKDGVSIQTREYTFDGLITEHKWTVDGEEKGLSWSKGDTTSASFDGAGWFAQVHTPDVVSAPDAIALSSSVPADDATDVAVDAPVVLTFNNKIASENIEIIDSATGNPMAITKSWDATGKILTISHAVNFTLNVMYIVPLVGVVDVYGQALAVETVTFTSVAA